MQVFERAREIILKPKDIWPVIKGEGVDIKQLLLNYAAPLMLIPALANLVNITIVGVRMPAGNVARAPFFISLVNGIVGYALSLLSLLIAAWVVQFLAPKFNSKADILLSVKLVVYSMTPVWLAGIFTAVPGFALLSILGLYGIYILAVGLPFLLETPPDKVVVYTVSIILLGLLVSFGFSLILMSLFYGPMYMKMMAI